MATIITPFRGIKVLIDGQPVPYFSQAGRKQDAFCPRVFG